MGISWTLDYDKAKFFADRHQGEVVIVKGRFKKQNVIAYFEREEEILISPSSLDNIEILKKYFNKKPTTNIFKKRQAESFIRFTKEQNNYKEMERIQTTI